MTPTNSNEPIDLLTCPTWCNQGPAGHLAEQGQYVPHFAAEDVIHSGPAMGPVQPWWDPTDDVWGANVDEGHGLTAKQLRDLASDALRAADWLDEQVALGRTGR